MGKREYLLRKIKQLEEERKQRKKVRQRDDSYRPRSMVVGMPFGCWIWIAVIVFLLFLGLKTMLK